jgi:hypothetical protein
MKLKASCILLASALLLHAAGPSMSDLLNAGQRAYANGDLAAAKDKFTAALAENPKSAVAQNYLRMIAYREKQGGGDVLKRKLGAVKLEKVDFRETSLSTVLDFLRNKAGEQSVQFGFVNELPKEKIESAKITLSLSNVPFLNALQYVCELAGAQFVVEQFAVKIKPAGAE